MMLSVMVMGAGAAFTDQDKIVNEEAVDMISALGIVDGYEDDSFQPEKNIERGEAAKMIAVMLNGGKDAVQDTSVSSFNDVLGSADAWANKYIEYGVSKGILAGVGGDRFAPASNVTGTQLAKMLLVSLGYDADKEGYLDDTSWAVNVNADAASVGLYAGVESIDMSAALTRDNAAQMIWNALQAETVRYSLAGQAVKTGDTLLETAFGADYGLYSGILTDISYNKDTKVYTYNVEECDSSANIIGWWHNDTFETTTDYTDLFAMNVKVLHNGDNALCIRTDKGGTVVEGTIGDIGGTSNTHFNTITVNGQKYTLDNVANDWEDLWSITCGYNQYFNSGWGDVNYDQYAFRAIDQDGGGDIDVIVVYPYVVLRTETVLNDTFVAREIVGSDASLTVGPDEQDRGLIADVLFDGENTSAQTGPMRAEIEYEDIVLNGTVAENGYVKVVPAEFTAQNIDTYTVLDINSGVANSLNTRDNMVTFGTTEYDGNLVNVVVPVSTISLGETYGFVEVNGYLFIVDGNNIGPVKDEYVVVTKTALAPQGVDKTWETNILKTDGTTETVDVYVSLNDQHYGPEVGSLYTYRVDLNGNYELIAVPYGTQEKADGTTNFDIQQAYKNGATLNNEVNAVYTTPGYWNYDVQYVGYNDGNDTYDADGNKTNTITTESYNLTIELATAISAGEVVYYNIDGTKDDVSPVQYTATKLADGATSGDVKFDGAHAVGTYYFAVKATWVEPTGFTWEWVNPGTIGMYSDDPVLAFYNYNELNSTADTSTKYYIEDNAVIFVYNRLLDEYSVVKGSELANVDEREVTWAFTGATSKVVNGTATVDLGYVAVNNDPDETLVYAYINNDPIRTTDANGKHILVVDVMLENGETVTLSTKAYANENDPDLMRLYSSLKEDGIFELIVDGTTLVDIKDYNPADSYTVEAKLYNGVIKLKDKAGVTKDYFVSTDTVFIPADGEVESIADIVKGATINAVIDGDDVLAVIY